MGVGVSPESARSYQDQVDTVPGVLREARLALAFYNSLARGIQRSAGASVPSRLECPTVLLPAQSDSSLLSPDWQNQKNIAEELLWASF